MVHTSKMFFIAGAALGLAATAFGAETTDTSRAYANELQADAAGRTSLAASKGSNGLTITDGSGNFSLRIGGLLQFRYTADFRSGSTANTTPGGSTNGGGGGLTGQDKATIGFSLPRAQLYFAGNAGSPELTYYIQGGFQETNVNPINNGGAVGGFNPVTGAPNPNGAPTVNNGQFQLEDAFMKYAFDNNWDVRWGQFKLPILTEDLIGDAYQQSIDRSFMADVYRQQRSQGIQVGYTADAFRVLGAFSDGWRSQNTDYNNANESDYALTLRVDGKFAGDWNQWNQFSSWQNSQFAAFLGGAVHWQQGGKTGDGLDATTNANQSNFFLWTIDTQIKGNGWNIYGAFVGSHAKTLSTATIPTSATNNSYGWQIQGGWFATQQIEIFGRYDGIWANSGIAGAGTTASPHIWNFLDFGLNYYMFPESQTAKISGDIVIGLNRDQNLQGINFQGNAATGQFVPGSSLAAPNTNAGVLGSPKAGEVALRAQFQLLF